MLPFHCSAFFSPPCGHRHCCRRDCLLAPFSRFGRVLRTRVTVSRVGRSSSVWEGSVLVQTEFHMRRQLSVPVVYGALNGCLKDGSLTVVCCRARAAARIYDRCSGPLTCCSASCGSMVRWHSFQWIHNLWFGACSRYRMAVAA